MHIYEALAGKVNDWRQQGYLSAQYPDIAEILDWCREPVGATFRLRPAQLRALETYWYLRLVENTPHVTALYLKLFPKQSERLSALGMTDQGIKTYVMDYGLDALLERIKTDDDFVRSFRLEAVRETLTLPYPSYILALAMGAGKTALIGSIIATEFAMAAEYQDDQFVENALVFAPGKTIIESLRQLTAIPYASVLPPRHYKLFAASVKLLFTRDGEKHIPVIGGSSFNVVVTNTEKIRIQKETIRKADLGATLFSAGMEDEAREELANARLRAIGSLPHLAIFSDEAHHTYGQALDTELKKVRKTVDYLAANTNVFCVVNTTGTPYFQRQPLRDVVIWYGLSQGIRDGILKEVAGSVRGYDFHGNVDAYLSEVVSDFVKDYWGVSLPDGTPAKLAIFFPQTDDVEQLRPLIEATLAAHGVPTTVVLEHHTRNENKKDFDRFKLVDSPHRIALLVDRGVEGWDVPALFACALARKLKTSNNFVLQAASRCLRQVPGNRTKARIYLSMDNYSILDRQLQETYGESIRDLNGSTTERRSDKLYLKKVSTPPLVISQVVRTVTRRPAPGTVITLTRPIGGGEHAMKRMNLKLADRMTGYAVLDIVDTIEITRPVQTIDIYGAAVQLAGNYRLDMWLLYDELRRVYADALELPLDDIEDLARQIEEQIRDYEVTEETVEKALALVRIDEKTGEPLGWDKETAADGTEAYTATITYPVDREKLLARWSDWKGKSGGFGFHYDPYNFDSNPEMVFFEKLLDELGLHPDNVEDIYFTGGITSADKTEFRVEYEDEKGKWRDYTPDFLIRRKDGRCLIVEIKREHERSNAIDGENGRKAMAARRWVGLNPDRLKYEIIFTPGDSITHDQTEYAREFIEEK